MTTLFERIQNLLGFEIPDNKKEKESVKTTSFIPPENLDGAFEVDVDARDVTTVASSQFLNFDGSFRNEVELINEYRNMMDHPEVDDAVDDIVNETIISENNLSPVKLNLDDMPNMSDSIKDKFSDSFTRILQLMQFSANGHDIFRDWYRDGRLYYHMELADKDSQIKKGIQKLIKVDATQISKIREMVKKTAPNGIDVIEREEEFFIYIPPGLTTAVIKVSPDAIAFINSGLIKTINNKPIIIGNLNKAIKSLNQLRMVEDGSVIYRLARAPERRIFYIDVGNLPKGKAEQYLQNIMQKYNNKIVYNSSDGTVKDQKHHLAITEDYYLPRREGQRGTEITTLPGGENLGQIDDIEYFKKKLHRALNVPSSRIESDSTFNLGRSSEITRDELKFAKFIGRLRKKFSQIFAQILKIELLSTNVITEDDWNKWKEHLKFDFISDSHFAELKNAEVTNDRLALLTTMDEFVGKYYSKEFIQKNVLRQSDKEIAEIKAQIKAEDKEGEINEFDPDKEEELQLGGAPEAEAPVVGGKPDEVPPEKPLDKPEDDKEEQ